MALFGKTSSGCAPKPGGARAQRRGKRMTWIKDLIDPKARAWEEFYRNRWQHDSVVRSTHGVNCTGSCSWMIHVKEGIKTRYPGIGPADQGRPSQSETHEPEMRSGSFVPHFYFLKRTDKPALPRISQFGHLVMDTANFRSCSVVIGIRSDYRNLMKIVSRRG
jgi:hypothetical protein